MKYSVPACDSASSSGHGYPSMSHLFQASKRVFALASQTSEPIVALVSAA